MIISRFYKPLFQRVYTLVIMITCVVLLHPPVYGIRSETTTTNTTASILLLESPGEDSDEIGVLPAIEMAIEDVNCNPEVLPGSTLTLLHNSTEEEVYRKKFVCV